MLNVKQQHGDYPKSVFTLVFMAITNYPLEQNLVSDVWALTDKYVGLNVGVCAGV